MPKYAKFALCAGAGAAAGSIITMMAIGYALRVPKELKKYMPQKKNEQR